MGYAFRRNGFSGFEINHVRILFYCFDTALPWRYCWWFSWLPPWSIQPGRKVISKQVISEYFFHELSIFSITPDITEFCLGEFIPEVRLATQSFNLTSEEFLRLEGNLFSTFTKLVYSFLWQVSFVLRDSETPTEIFGGKLRNWVLLSQYAILRRLSSTQPFYHILCL